MKKQNLIQYLVMLFFMVMFMPADAFGINCDGGGLGCGRDRMITTGMVLGPGSSMISVGEINNYRYTSSLTLQPNGNLVLICNGKKVWETNTAGHNNVGGLYFSNEVHSRLHLIDTNGNIYWEVNVGVHTDGTCLVLQPFGALAIFRRIPNNPYIPVEIFADRLPTWSSDSMKCESDIAAPSIHAPKLRAGDYIGSFREGKLAKMILGADGNLVHYINGQKVWESRTFGNPGAYVSIGGPVDDGFRILSSQHNVLYALGGASISIGNSGHLYATTQGIITDDDGLDVNKLDSEDNASWGTWIPIPTNKLRANQTIEIGKDLKSANQSHILTIQDGNLILKQAAGLMIWKTSFTGQSPNKLVMQPDGNLVLYNTANQRLWASNTTGNDGTYLQVENNGKLVIYDGLLSSKPIWASDTLYPNNILKTTHQICSTNGLFTLRMTPDGYLALYYDFHYAQQKIWDSYSATGSNTCKMNSDGNLTITDLNGSIIWQSNTAGNPGSRFVVQHDGNIVIYNAAGAPIWDRFSGRLY